MQPQRISKDEYYMNIAREVALRCTCYRARHWAVIIKDDQIVSTGYVWAPRKTKDCFERGNCLRDILWIPSGQRYELCRSVHAEQNAIINAARSWTNIFWAKMYIYSVKLDKDWNETLIDALPCFICRKMIVNSWIDEVISHRKDDTLKTYKVEDWASEWQIKDMLESDEQYCWKYNIK